MSAVLKEKPELAPMREHDLAELMPIESALYTHPWTRGNFADSLRAGYECRTYRLHGELIGYFVLMAAAGEAHLLNLSVAEPHQRRGYGTALLNEATALAHEVDPLGRLERPNEHGRADALTLGYRIQQGVNAVRPVHVCKPGLSEQRSGTRRHTGEGVAGRLLLVVALDLDDAAGGVAVAHHAADEVPRDVVHRPVIEAPRARVDRRPAWLAHSARASRAPRARSSCSRTRASAVPPSETFDSTEAPSARAPTSMPSAPSCSRC